MSFYAFNIPSSVVVGIVSSNSSIGTCPGIFSDGIISSGAFIGLDVFTGPGAISGSGAITDFSFFL